MADTLDLVDLPANVWVDAYAATGISANTALIINVINTKTEVVGSISATEPPLGTKKITPIPPLNPGLSGLVTAGENGFWLFSTSKSTVSVQDGT